MPASPEHVALFGFAWIMVCAPVLVLMLASMSRGPTRWMGRGLAIAITALWLPLAYAAPAILAQLV